jgi:hypothetical protein
MTEFITQDDLDRLLKSGYQNVSVVHGEPEPGYEITRCSPYPETLTRVDELTRGYEFTKTQLAELEQLRADLTEAGKWKEAVTAACMQVEGCLIPDPVQTMKALCDYWFSAGMAEQQTVMETDLILKLRENVDFWADDSSQKSLERDALRAENAALKKDAARYQWLRRGGNDDIGVGIYDPVIGDFCFTCWYQELDYIIDDAMEKQNADK